MFERVCGSSGQVAGASVAPVCSVLAGAARCAERVAACLQQLGLNNVTGENSQLQKSPEGAISNPLEESSEKYNFASPPSSRTHVPQPRADVPLHSLTQWTPSPSAFRTATQSGCARKPGRSAPFSELPCGARVPANTCAGYYLMGIHLTRVR